MIPLIPRLDFLSNVDEGDVERRRSTFAIIATSASATAGPWRGRRLPLTVACAHMGLATPALRTSRSIDATATRRGSPVVGEPSGIELSQHDAGGESGEPRSSRDLLEYRPSHRGVPQHGVS